MLKEKPLILSLESSTTSAKALLYNPKTGAVERVVSEAYPERAWLGAGLHDPQVVAACTFKLGREICADTPRSGGGSIEAIAVCGTFHSVLVCSANGAVLEPVTPTYTWMSTVAEGLAARLRAGNAYTRAYYRRTGCMVHALYPAFQLMALRDERFDFAGKRVSSESGFVFWLLTGEHLETACTNSGGGLISVHTRRWDEATLAEIGLSAENMAPLVDYRDTCPLSPGGAALLGLPAGIPVLPSHPDGALNQVGAGALVPGVMTFSMGTSAALRLSVESPLVPAAADNNAAASAPPAAPPATWCYLSPSSWLCGAAVNGACNCVDWIKPMLYPTVNYADIERAAPDYRAMPYFLPFIFGERCPGWDDGRAGGFYGLRARHTPLDLYYSVLEGVLFNLYQCYESLCAAAGAPHQIQLSGGILNSAHWKEMCAALFGRALHCAKVPHASLVGGAVLAMEVCGHIAKKEDYTVDITEVAEPREELRSLLSERYKKYLAYYSQ